MVILVLSLASAIILGYGTLRYAWLMGRAEDRTSEGTEQNR